MPLVAVFGSLMLLFFLLFLFLKSWWPAIPTVIFFVLTMATPSSRLLTMHFGPTFWVISGLIAYTIGLLFTLGYVGEDFRKRGEGGGLWCVSFIWPISWSIVLAITAGEWIYKVVSTTSILRKWWTGIKYLTLWPYYLGQKLSAAPVEEVVAPVRVAEAPPVVKVDQEAEFRRQAHQEVEELLQQNQL